MAVIENTSRGNRGFDGGRLVLKHGRNTVKDDLWAREAARPSTQALIKDGVLIVHEAPLPPPTSPAEGGAELAALAPAAEPEPAPTLDLEAAAADIARTAVALDEVLTPPGEEPVIAPDLEDVSPPPVRPASTPPRSGRPHKHGRR